MVNTPAYLKQRDKPGDDVVASGKSWLRSYLREDVQSLQEHKQHHVHIWDEEKQEYMPLEHCRGREKKNICKSKFPRTKWLIKKAVVLCVGLCRQMELAVSGRKNVLGSMHGPMNEPNINGTHPAMLVAQRFNSDVQLPYRLPLNAHNITNYYLDS